MSATIRNLSFGYIRGRPVLEDVSFELVPGAVTAVAGPNGAGKSTLLRLLLGVLAPVRGEVLVDGRRVRSIGQRERARRIAYIPQQTSLAFAFTLRQFVRLGRYAAAAGEDDGAVDAALELADLRDRADDPFAILSAGQQQRGALARALAQLDAHTLLASAGADRDADSDADADPRHAAEPATRLLLADEPVAAMDPRHTLATMNLLGKLARHGVTVVAVLHDLTLAARWCDHAVLLSSAGRLAAAGPVATALAPERLGEIFEVPFVRLAGPGDALAVVPA